MTRHPFRGPLLSAAGLVAAGAAVNLSALHGFRLRQVAIPMLPPGWTPIRVLHLSDLHLAPWQHAKIRWVRALSALSPDLIVDTGDNLGHARALGSLAYALNPLLSIPGIFVDGGNDFYAPRPRNPARYLLGPSHHEPGGKRLNTARMHRLFTAAGWHDLNNTATTISLPQGTLRVLGIGDAHEGRDDLPTALQRLHTLPDTGPLISVTHAPYQRILNACTAAGAALCFAGHTHGGQLRLPGYGAILTNCDLPREDARGAHLWTATSGDQMHLHVSAGLGTSIYAPVRIFCPPEATLVTLTARPAGA